MPDREKVIKGLRCCSHTDGVNCIYCPYDISDSDCTALLSMDVLELLKEQEPQLVLNIGEQISCKSGSCPKCGKMLNTTCNKRYCGDCGQEVKWK